MQIDLCKIKFVINIYLSSKVQWKDRHIFSLQRILPWKDNVAELYANFFILLFRFVSKEIKMLMLWICIHIYISIHFYGYLNGVFHTLCLNRISSTHLSLDVLPSKIFLIPQNMSLKTLKNISYFIFTSSVE